MTLQANPQMPPPFPTNNVARCILKAFQFSAKNKKPKFYFDIVERMIAIAIVTLFSTLIYHSQQVPQIIHYLCVVQLPKIWGLRLCHQYASVALTTHAFTISFDKYLCKHGHQIYQNDKFYYNTIFLKCERLTFCRKTFGNVVFNNCLRKNEFIQSSEHKMMLRIKSL